MWGVGCRGGVCGGSGHLGRRRACISGIILSRDDDTANVRMWDATSVAPVWQNFTISRFGSAPASAYIAR